MTQLHRFAKHEQCEPPVQLWSRADQISDPHDETELKIPETLHHANLIQLSGKRRSPNQTGSMLDQR